MSVVDNERNSCPYFSGTQKARGRIHYTREIEREVRDACKRLDS